MTAACSARVSLKSASLIHFGLLLVLDCSSDKFDRSSSTKCNMASGGVGSNTLYQGRVECVKKAFGFIRLDNNNPVSRAFFDRHSIPGAGKKLDDLTEHFSAGSRIEAKITLTDGEHKVKYRAKDLRIARGGGDKSKKGGDEYLKHHMRNGARQLDKLAADLSTTDRNCPRFLRKNDTQEILSIVLRRYDWFVMKNGFVCLKDVEDGLVKEIMNKMDDYNGRIPFDVMTQIIPPEHDDRRYLHSTEQWNVGIKDFVSRNSHMFVYWDEHIWSKKYLFSHGEFMNKFQQDLLAVLFYSHFVSGPVQIRSLSGHYNQASNEVKEVCKPREPDFKEFLERNAFFFVVRGSQVQECPTHRLACITNSWQSKKTKSQSASFSTAKPTAKPRKSSEPKSPTTNPIIPPLLQIRPTTMPKKIETDTGNSISKAFSDMQAEFQSPKFTLGKCGQQDFSCRQTTEEMSPFLFQPSQFQPPTTPGLYSSHEAAVFKKLIGDQMSSAIQDEILANDNLNSLILLRLNVGKPPMALFRIPGEKNGLKHDLNVEPCRIEDIQRILRQPEVIKSNECTNRYGVTGTLHSILTRESGNKVSSLTLRCQMHETSEGLGLEMQKWKNFTAVFTGNYPDKHMYNFLRTSCNSLSKTEDVLVIDVDGQLCPLILESIQHMHGYMITIGIDSTKHLKAIQKMCGQGTKVMAAVSCELKAEAQALF